MPHLSWLPVHEDFDGSIRVARGYRQKEERLDAAVTLAGYDRDAIATTRVDRLLDNFASGPGGKLSEFRLALLGSHTLDHLLPAIRVAGLNQKLAIRTWLGSYGLFREPLLLGDEGLAEFNPQAVLISLDLAAVVPQLSASAGRAAALDSVSDAMDGLRALWNGARNRYGVPVIQQTFLPQAPRLAGSNEWLLPASPVSLCDRLNFSLREAAATGEVLLLDLEQVREFGPVGLELHDPARWHQAKQLINPALSPLHGECVARILGALAGKARRCLVLDLDNTLWGGVIGDSGVEGIVLGQGSAAGEAYLAFQHYVRMLRDRGVVLAVCSKNDHEFARSAFDRHPEMKLSYDDVACFVANWSDKACNLRTIAGTLNLGLDSLVFVDDNPAERLIVRRELPDVAVPELPDDVAHYARTLAAAGYFEAAALTGEDLARAEDYRVARLRQVEAAPVTDMEGFLASLCMRMEAGPIRDVDRPRAVQLINKSNQFNLTTRRRGEAELAELCGHRDVAALAFRLRDRFGDSGLISVLIARPDDDWPGDLLIDTWLMSCRVLGRGVERAALHVLREAARKLGARALIGEYRPSERNGMVQDHYEKLGFAQIEGPKGASGSRFWRLDLECSQDFTHHIALEIAR